MLFNLAQLRAKTKVQTVLIRELLFTDDASLTTHKEEELQQLISQFSHAYKEFGLTISIRRMEVMGQEVPSSPSITIINIVLEVADHFTYLGSTISSNLSLHSEIDKCIVKAASVMARLRKRVWSNNQLTSNTKLGCTRCAFSARSCMAVNLEQPMQDKKTAWRASTSAACVASWTSWGRTRSPTLLYWSVLAPSACTSSCASAGSNGWAMYIVLMTATSQKMCCTGIWQQDTAPQATWCCTSWMSTSVISRY